MAAGFPAWPLERSADRAAKWSDKRLALTAAGRVREMRSIVVAVVLCAGMASLASAQDAKAKGEKIYVDQKCSLCHSIAGKGNAKGALDSVGSTLSADEIRSWITDAKGMTVKMKTTRKPDMKAYALPKDDVDALVAYLGALKK